jgi:hypothetical protein
MAAAGLLGVVVAASAWIRWPRLGHGLTGDELGLLQFHGFERLLNESLSRLHPPFYRTVFRVFLDPMAAIEAGRLWSMACGLLGILVIGGLAWRISGSRVAGLVGAAFYAALPSAVIWSAFHRPYTTLVLLTAAHLWAVIRWCEARDRGRWLDWLPVVLTAVFLPQVHYFAVPWLMCFAAVLTLSGCLSWRRVWVYAPALVAFLPMLWLLLTPQDGGKAHRSGDVAGALQYVLSMGLFWSKHVLSSMLPVSVAALAIPVLFWRRVGLGVRVCWIGAVASILSVMAAATQHGMTSSTTLLGVAALVPLMCALPVVLAVDAPRWRRPIAVVATLIMIFSARLVHDRFSYEVEAIKPPDRLQVFLDDWEHLVPSTHTVQFAFSTDHTVARLVLKGWLLGQGEDAECAGQRQCFFHGGRRWGVVSGSAQHESVPTTLVYSRVPPELPLPASCVLRQAGPKVVWVVSCMPAE